MGKKRRRNSDEEDANRPPRGWNGMSSSSGALGGSVVDAGTDSHAVKFEGTVKFEGSSINDEWQTTLEAWKQIGAVLFDQWKHRRVWMPFYYDGECADHVRSCGFSNVIHKQEDFYKRVRDPKFMKKVDLIWDNPPYTTPETKEKLLRTLAETGKPFVMLLPISCLHVQFVRELLDGKQVQVVIPRRVLVRKTGKELIPFKYLCWLCYRTKLPRDLYLVDGDDD